MRIELSDRDRDHKLRRQTRRRRPGRGAMQHFEAAIARPRLQERRRAQRATPEPRAKAPAMDRQGRVPETTPRTPRVPLVRARRTSRPAAVQATRPIRWQRVLLKLAAVLLVGGLATLIVYGSASPKFFVYSATVAGARHLSAEAIYQAARVHEQSIFWVHPGQVETRIAQMAGIKSVHVTCRLPVQVRIEVEERQPAVMWRVSAQQRDWWLDEEGVVLPYHGDVNDTLFVVDSSPRELHEGDRLQPEGMVSSVKQLAAALPGNNIFYYGLDRGLSFMHKEQNGDKWPVFVGTTEDLPHKIAILRTLTEYLLAHNIRPRYIDVRWADHPVYGAPEGEAVEPSG